MIVDGVRVELRRRRRGRRARSDLHFTLHRRRHRPAGRRPAALPGRRRPRRGHARRRPDLRPRARRGHRRATAGRSSPCPAQTFGPELDVHADFDDRRRLPAVGPVPPRRRRPSSPPRSPSRPADRGGTVTEADDRPMPPTAPRQRVIGMLGGMSWESTAEYYRLANEGVRAAARRPALGPDACSPRSTSPRSRRCRSPARWDEAGEVLAAEAARGWRRAARSCSCCAPTRCTRSPTGSQAAVGIPLLHLADTTADAVRRRGPDDGRAAGHRVHDGAGLLPRPARRPRPARARPGRGRPRRGAPGHLRRALPGSRPRGVAPALPAASSSGSSRPARRASSSAAPRSNC